MSTQGQEDRSLQLLRIQGEPSFEGSDQKEGIAVARQGQTRDHRIHQPRGSGGVPGGVQPNTTKVRDTVQRTGESLLSPIMSVESTSPLPVSAEANRSRIMTGDFISVGGALKLVPYFKGNKQEVLAFIGNVDTAFAASSPTQEDVLYKFVLTRISGEPRTAISHRNLDSWVELKEFLKNSYIEKRTLDFHASQLFAAKQRKYEKVAEWIQRIQLLESQFREAALLNCSEGAREGILDLSDRLRNICFVQGLGSDRIQTIVRSRNYRNFDEIAETALVEESAITSRAG